MTQNKNGLEIYGQYASDHLLGPGASDDTLGTLDYRGDGNIGFHQENLHDQIDGIYDYATGETRHDPGFEEQMYGGEDMRIVAEYELGHAAVGNDDADQWMKQHGFKW